MSSLEIDLDLANSEILIAQSFNSYRLPIEDNLRRLMEA